MQKVIFTQGYFQGTEIFNIFKQFLQATENAKQISKTQNKYKAKLQY